MDVIVIETQAFYNLVETVINRLLAAEKKSTAKIEPETGKMMDAKEAMTFFGITNQKYFYRFISKENVPFIKIGKKYHFNRAKVIEFMSRKSPKPSR